MEQHVLKLRKVLGITDNTDSAAMKSIFETFQWRAEEDTSVTLAEFEKGLKESTAFKDHPENTFTTEQIAALFNYIDKKCVGDGNVKLSELTEVLRPTLSEKRKAFLKKYFDILSTGADGIADGVIDIKDMRRLTLGDATDDSMDEFVKEMLNRCERAGEQDDKLTFPEFMANHVRQSQQTFGDDKAFGEKVKATWDVDMEFSW